MPNLIQVLIQWLCQKTHGVVKQSSTTAIDVQNLQAVRLKASDLEDLVTESRPLQPIRRVRVEGAFLVDFKCDGTVKLTVSGKARDVATLKTYYVEDTLVVEQKATNAALNKPLVVVLRLPTAPDIAVLGSTTVSMTNIAQAKLCFEINGSGDVLAEGMVKSLEVSVQGSGDLNAKELIADKATVSVKGSGNAKVAVRKEVIGWVGGSGSLGVHGQPTTRDVKVSGSGSIKFR